MALDHLTDPLISQVFGRAAGRQSNGRGNKGQRDGQVANGGDGAAGKWAPGWVMGGLWGGGGRLGLAWLVWIWWFVNLQRLFVL